MRRCNFRLFFPLSCHKSQYFRVRIRDGEQREKQRNPSFGRAGLEIWPMRGTNSREFFHFGCTRKFHVLSDSLADTLAAKSCCGTSKFRVGQKWNGKSKFWLVSGWGLNNNLYIKILYDNEIIILYIGAKKSTIFLILKYCF